ncbi:TPA: dCMP deaminase family protein [Candidatus Poribacteria bacterium]|nr:dCMP deaminase family protein [Candidatus Poribacteria bacterium]
MGAETLSEIKFPRESWDEYFYSIAEKVASRSRDDSKVGVVFVDSENTIVSTGYNGLPRRVSDDKTRINDDKEKLRWTVHAEANAICNAARTGMPTKNCIAYVTKFPCSRCAGELVQAGIIRLVTFGKMWKNDPNGDDGRRSWTILSESGVAVYAPKILMIDAKDTYAPAA